MKYDKLIMDLKNQKIKIDTESNSKGFISNQVTSDWGIALGYLIKQLNSEGVQIEPIEENGVQFCGICNQKVSLKKRRIERSMIEALLIVFDYCIETNQKTFIKKDINFTNVQYVLLPFLKKFGLLYKRDGMKVGEYGIPFKRVGEFMKG